MKAHFVALVQILCIFVGSAVSAPFPGDNSILPGGLGSSIPGFGSAFGGHYGHDNDDDDELHKKLAFAYDQGRQAGYYQAVSGATAGFDSHGNPQATRADGVQAAYGQQRNRGKGYSEEHRSVITLMVRCNVWHFSL
ncbi:hypothetical protein O181_075244 [Austropuccinia psidii MF-1]|uniref:Uncharacterized protein n=1 Tax=Austropuccinia psidii MF-1 TaxID=1389203 RepID=A0A9Q3FA74_9BASI|nr:hypothetical protein [Austropuccinia psidii MF-1]